MPYVGHSRVPNLFLNTGHGTLGWTHACGSGALIADVVCGRKPELALGPEKGVRPHFELKGV